MKKYQETIEEWFLLVIGSILMAFGTGCFLLPNQLSSGGVSGIATILYYLLQIPMSTTIIMINIPIFIFALIREGKSFLIRSLVATFLFSNAIDFFDKITAFTQDKILSSVYGGIVIGLGLALVFKGKGSTGGTDLMANIIRSYNRELTIGSVLQILDIVVVSLNMIFLGEIEIGLYSAITIYLMNKMFDLTFEGINFSKIIYIISDQYEEISKVIHQEVKRGATGIYAKGTYTNEKKIMIMCVANRKNIIKIKELAQKIDSNAFIIITDAREVYGLGFKN